MAEDMCWRTISVKELSEILHHGVGKRLIVDSRSFLEFNTCHIAESINVSSSKLIKRRLQQDKLCVQELLSSSSRVDIDLDFDIIVYDQCTANPASLASDCFLAVLVNKLQTAFNSVYLLKGGFLEFQAAYPGLCRSQSACSVSSSGGGYKCPPLMSMSQPCLPVSNVGPTKILPFLFLGSQHDALSQETMQQNGITYVLNVSTSSPRPPFIQEGHFLRVPVNDSYCDKLLPFFQDAFQFLDKVRESNSCALVHCLAGISRSPTLAIAYIMRHLGLTTDEAYKYVKDKRPTISPNFNFLGQLLEYEHLLHSAKTATDAEDQMSASQAKKQCFVDLLSPESPTLETAGPRRPARLNCGSVINANRLSSKLLSLASPTTALAQLNFTQPSPVVEESSPASSVCEETDHEGNDMSLFASLKMTTLDQLNFTPCFAYVGEQPAAAQRAARSGAKRLLDDELSAACVPHSCEDDCVVTLRPPRSDNQQAKRPLVRPSSIAFCTPEIDSSSCHQEQVVNKFLASAVTSEHLTRKSRSLEDILNSPEVNRLVSETDTVADTAKTRPMSNRPPSAIDILGPLTCTDGSVPHWWPVVPQSAEVTSDRVGSASSSSRNSLHGSVEVIEVS